MLGQSLDHLLFLLVISALACAGFRIWLASAAERVQEWAEDLLFAAVCFSLALGIPLLQGLARSRQVMVPDVGLFFLLAVPFGFVSLLWVTYLLPLLNPKTRPAAGGNDLFWLSLSTAIAVTLTILDVLLPK